MLANRAGSFNAYPLNIGIGETGPNNLATCTIDFALVEEVVNGEWRDCTDEGLTILGYFYLEKRDGSVNHFAIHVLKKALGWDGRDPFWLQDTDLSKQPVQVKLAYETYEGRQRLKVQFLNPYGAAPTGVSKADDATRRSINLRLGAKLRAQAAARAATTAPPAPAPPQEKPTAEEAAQPLEGAPPGWENRVADLLALADEKGFGAEAKQVIQGVDAAQEQAVQLKMFLERKGALAPVDSFPGEDLPF